MQDIIEVSNRQMIKMENNLNRAKYHLSPVESDIIFKMITEIDKDDKDFKKYIYKVVDLEKWFNKKFQRNDLQKIAKSIMSKPLTIKESNGGFLVINWLSSFRYKGKEGNIELTFHPDLKPYLLELQKNFLTFEGKIIFTLSSMYSKRIYPILMEEINQEEFICNKSKEKPKYKYSFKLDYLQEILQVPESLKVFADFKRRVLEVSISEINENTDLKIDYTVSKTGKKTTGIEFIIIEDNRNNTKKEKHIDFSEFKEFQEWFKQHYKGYEDVLQWNDKTIGLTEEGWFKSQGEFYSFKNKKSEIEEIWKLIFQNKKKWIDTLPAWERYNKKKNIRGSL